MYFILKLLIIFSIFLNKSWANSTPKFQLSIDSEFSFLFAGPSAGGYRLLAGYEVTPKILLFAGGGESSFGFQDSGSKSSKTDNIDISGKEYVLGMKYTLNEFKAGSYLTTFIGKARGQGEFSEVGGVSVLTSKHHFSFSSFNIGFGINRLLLKSKNFGYNLAILETIVKLDSVLPSYISKKEIVVLPPKIVLGLYVLI